MSSADVVDPIARVPRFLLLAVAIAGWVGPGCGKSTSLRVGTGGNSGTTDSGNATIPGGGGTIDGDTSFGGAGGTVEAGGSTSGATDGGDAAVSGGGDAVDGDTRSGGADGTVEAGGRGGAGGRSEGDADSVDTEICDGAALSGVWRRAVDGLVMILAADGCAISGTADNSGYHHTIIGSYDDATRTMRGTMRRTTISSGCATIMTVTLVLTDSTHFLAAITGTDGRCDLLTTYNEASVWVRQ